MHFNFIDEKCIIKDFKCMEDIHNNSVYVIDKNEHKIRKAKYPDEYFTHQTVFVFNYLEILKEELCPLLKEDYNRILKKGTLCRCWFIDFRMTTKEDILQKPAEYFSNYIK